MRSRSDAGGVASLSRWEISAIIFGLKMAAATEQCENRLNLVIPGGGIRQFSTAAAYPSRLVVHLCGPMSADVVALEAEEVKGVTTVTKFMAVTIVQVLCNINHFTEVMSLAAHKFQEDGKKLSCVLLGIRLWFMGLRLFGSVFRTQMGLGSCIRE